MIHIGPPPGLARLRLHWHVVRTNFERQYETVRETIQQNTEAVSARYRQVQARFFAVISLRARANARQQERLAKFEAAYEEIVDVICWAAKEDADPRQDERYARLRIAMRLSYRPLRREMRSHWICAEEPDAADPFEALFVPDDIDAVINAATGIENMIRTRNAFESYREHLGNRETRRLN